MKEERERVVLVGVATSEQDDTEESIAELAELVRTAGADAAGTVLQNREAPHPGNPVLNQPSVHFQLFLARASCSYAAAQTRQGIPHSDQADRHGRICTEASASPD